MQNEEEGMGSPIGTLPSEVLLAIFSYLQTYDVKYVVSKVCVRWSNLSRDRKLWKRLNFQTTNRAKKIFGRGSWYSTLKFLESTPELQNVIVSRGHSEEEIVEILNALNGHCRQLNHIEFADVEADAIARHLPGLDGILETVESLKLNLSNGQSQWSLFKVLAGFKKLKKIAFEGANPHPTGFRLLLRDSPRLENLNVAGVDFSKENFMSLWKFKEKFVSLTIKIDKLDENCLKLLSVFPNLSGLTITDGNSSPGKLGKVGRMKCLKSLHLQENPSSPVLTSAAITDFFQAGCFSHLIELKLHKSRLNDEGAAEIRRNCPNLTYLEVMTYPRCLSSLSKKALLHFLHCRRLQHFEILFDKSEEADWIYRRIRHVHHDCDVDGTCPIGLEKLLDCWDEIQIPVD